MQIDETGLRDEALSFLIAHNNGVLATVSDENKPRARTVYYTCDDAFNIYFITLANTRKVADITAHPQAALVVSEADLPRTLQVEGNIQDLTDSAAVDPMLVDFVHTIMTASKYGPPLARFDTSTLRFYKLTPTWVRWGNFLFGKSTDDVLTLIDTKEEDL
jgi:general stress protein 26